ncbi:hypothetical protein M2451_000905 [Dysgonomonas sp. PFB1-18]|uniref:hypothetical protein n=1 Tax=unclassified Dysgonomonas TaxID=2630389 RepID=UPI0024771E8B|nr:MULTISPECIES: hypothetical protein [unclassified Dysgonomonas]MDH6308594.1 hypothetical protein [Dysgonomonas sp. PF1-14]MDH6338095.1 hypothetical protein [Dysgonomonas sp. PF1-16]MDH6379592.1 hypothetical protein [Dysgonomonas sp. PFB1-18]MDH6396922.1 hypothetical protein [Dysgonomonas sp. PF1-23]
MKTKLSVLLLGLLMTSFSLMYAQGGVTVGMGESPIEGAILQVKTIPDNTSNGDVNATQGVGLPRVALVKKNQLQPMYSAADAVLLDETKKKAHKGLLVYNTQEVAEEELVIGLNYWDGEKWVPVSETQSKAEVEIDCNKVRVYGKYYRLVPVTSSNYIVLPVNVTKKGDYNIMATTGNGYYFQASGTFADKGKVELRLEAMGTPGAVQVDGVTFTNNGSPIPNTCTIEIDVQVATMTYRIESCEDIKVVGDYQTRREMSGSRNYVEIPVNVIMDGTTTWETDLINGIKFVVNQTFDALGETTLVAKAQGVPKKSGKYTYEFVTDGAVKNECSFVVEFFSTLGTYGDPACKCLDIYEERPDVTNGEYFLLDCLDGTGTATPVKTFCDIVNGGYTLVWSFSERTSRNTYAPINNMSLDANYRFAVNTERNRVTTEDGIINYADYRLSRKEFQHFPNSTTNPQLKVRICENPTDMNDPWGLNNYGVISPRNAVENPIESIFGPLLVPSVGKLYGKAWEQKAAGGGAFGGWDEVTGNHHIALYSNASYPTHWDWGFLALPDRLFDVVPDKGGDNNQMSLFHNNNMFGWFGEDQPNHHFGKCNSATADDFDFSVKRCAGHTNLYPHSSLNGGEGRYLQWFVK